MRLNDEGGGMTPEESAAEFMRSVKSLLSAALRRGLDFHWEVRRHTCAVNGGTHTGTNIELTVEPQGDGGCSSGEDD